MKMRFYVILIEFAAAFSLQVRSEVVTTGTFFKRKENGDEGISQLPADQPLFTQELFECGRKESCSNILMYKNAKEHQAVDDVKAESQNKPVDFWEKDTVSCGDNYTPWNAHEYKMTTLDRHRPDCGPEKVLTMFHLQRDAANIRYHYTCCHFKEGVLAMQSRTSLFDYDGHLDNQNGDMVFLDRHAVNCSANGFASAFRVERNISSAEIRYNYQCAILKSNNLMLNCYSAVTPFTQDGHVGKPGSVYFLDRQTVQCNSGYALSYFKLERNFPVLGKIRYAYKCCKVN